MIDMDADFSLTDFFHLNMNKSTLQWCIVAIFFIVVFVIYQKKKMNSKKSDDEFLGGMDHGNTATSNLNQILGKKFQKTSSSSNDVTADFSKGIIRLFFKLAIPILIFMGVMIYMTFSSTGMNFGSFFTDNGASTIQEQEWESGCFSEDGNYYVYTSQAIGMQGITSYLQVIDCQTQKKVLKKPISDKRILWIIQVDGSEVWIHSKDTKSTPMIDTPILFDVKTGKVKWDMKDLWKLNPDFSMKAITRYYRNTTEKQGIIFEGEDGRKYFIRSLDGKIEKINGEFEHLDLANSDVKWEIVRNYSQDYSSSGSRKAMIRRSNKEEIKSKNDFIEPEVINSTHGVNDESSATNFPLTYKSNIFIVSQVSTVDRRDKILTMLDSVKMETQREVSLSQEKNRMDGWYNKERYTLKNDIFYWANRNYLYTIDVKTGKIKNTISLFK